jgi:hypothetical protein
MPLDYDSVDAFDDRFLCTYGRYLDGKTGKLCDTRIGGVHDGAGLGVQGLLLCCTFVAFSDCQVLEVILDWYDHYCDYSGEYYSPGWL